MSDKPVVAYMIKYEGRALPDGKFEMLPDDWRPGKVVFVATDLAIRFRLAAMKTTSLYRNVSEPIPLVEAD